MKLIVPTELSAKQIAEFQRIYKERFGEDISRDEAIKEGLSLIHLVAIVINKDTNTKNKPSITKD